LDEFNEEVEKQENRTFSYEDDILKNFQKFEDIKNESLPQNLLKTDSNLFSSFISSNY
jgi:hypothetical protein